MCGTRHHLCWDKYSNMLWIQASILCYPFTGSFFPCLPFGGDLLNLAEPNVCCHDLAIFGLAACGASTMRQELFLVVFESCGVLFSFGGRGKLWQQQYRTQRNVGLLSIGISSFPKLLHAVGSLCSHTHRAPHPFLLIQNDRRSPELILQQNHSVWSTQTVTLSQSLKSGELPSLLVFILSRGRMENWQQDYKSTEEWSVQMQMSWWLHLVLGTESRGPI